MEYPINDAGVALVKESEDFIDHAYPDPASPMGTALQKAGLWRAVVYRNAPIPAEFLQLSALPWTIGYGFTGNVKPGDTTTVEESDARLAHEMQVHVDVIRAACTLAPNENQLAAMLCLSWNIGLGWDNTKPKPKGAKDGFRQSTVLRAHNRGDFAAAARAFALWNKAGGRVLPPLETRRRKEATLYSTPVAGAEPAPMPQKVDAEGSMAKSPIIAGSAITGGATTLATVAQSSTYVKTIREDLGDLLPWALGAVAVAGAGWAIWSRLKQRKGGWA